MMRKKILYILSGILLLAGCRQENLTAPSGEGYLSVGNIELQAQTITEIASRAVDATLLVELWKGGVKVRELSVDEMQNKIELDAADDYTLKVYSSNYGEETSWGNADKGEPVYYKEVPFRVKEGETTSLKIQVPMIDFAVCLDLSNVTGEWLSEYNFTVTSGGRSVSLKDGETAYFPYAEGVFFTYQLDVTNTDSESNTQSGSWGNKDGQTVNINTLYTISYNWSTRSLVVN